MEHIQEIWNTYGNWVVGVLGTGFGAAVMAFVARMVANVVSGKITRSFDINAISSKVTEQVTQNITGNVIDVGISALVEDCVARNFEEVQRKTETTYQTVNEIKNCVSMMAIAISKSRLLTEDEQKALASEAEVLGTDARLAKKKSTKIELLPAVTTKDEPKETKKESKSEGKARKSLSFDEVTT